MTPQEHPIAASVYIAAVWAGLAAVLHDGGDTWSAASLHGLLMAVPAGALLILGAMILVAPFGILGAAAVALHDRWRYR